MTKLLKKYYECIFIELKLIPEYFIDQFNLCRIEHKDVVHAEFHGGKYGLLHSCELVRKDITACIIQLGEPGLWLGSKTSLPLTVAVQDFGVKHASLEVE